MFLLNLNSQGGESTETFGVLSVPADSTSHLWSVCLYSAAAVFKPQGQWHVVVIAGGAGFPS